MNNVLDIFMSSEDIENIKFLAKKRGFKSVSKYIEHLIEIDKDLMVEKDLSDNIER